MGIRERLNIGKIITGDNRRILIKAIKLTMEAHPDEDIKLRLMKFIRNYKKNEFDIKFFSREGQDRRYFANFRKTEFIDQIEKIKDRILRSRESDKFGRSDITTMDIVIAILQDLDCERQSQNSNIKDTIEVYYGNICLKVSKFNYESIIKELARRGGLTFSTNPASDNYTVYIDEELINLGNSDRRGIITVSEDMIDSYIEHSTEKEIDPFNLIHHALMQGKVIINDMPVSLHYYRS